MPVPRSTTRRRAAGPALLLALGAMAIGAFTVPRPGWTQGPGPVTLPQAFDILDLAPTTELQPTALNDAGQVAGFAGFGGQFEAGSLVRYDPGVGLRSFGKIPGAGTMEPTDINNLGAIVGTSADGGSGKTFYLSPEGALQEITAPGVFILSRAWAINEANQVVVGYDTGRPPRGGVWKEGVLTALGAPGNHDADRLIGRDINNTGTVVGGNAYLVGQDIGYQVARWTPSPGNIEVLRDAQMFQSAQAINNTGQILFWRYEPKDPGLDDVGLYLYEADSAVTPVGRTAYAGTDYDTAMFMALNDSGQVLFDRIDPDTGAMARVLWQQGQFVNPASLIPQTTGYQHINLWGMNNLGQIVAAAVREDGSIRALVLSPRVPDSTAPTVTVNSPAEGAVVDSPVAIRASINDAATVFWKLVIEDGTFGGSFFYGITKGENVIDLTRVMPGGARSFTLTVTDSSGNRTVVTRNFSVDLHPALKSFGITPASARGGAKVTGKVEFTAPVQVTGSKVTFTSSNPALKPPPALKLFAGTLHTTFPYTTPRVRKTTTFQITARYGGVSKKVRLTLRR